MKSKGKNMKTKKQKQNLKYQQLFFPNKIWLCTWSATWVERVILPGPSTGNQFHVCGFIRRWGSITSIHMGRCQVKTSTSVTTYARYMSPKFTSVTLHSLNTLQLVTPHSLNTLQLVTQHSSPTQFKHSLYQLSSWWKLDLTCIHHQVCISCQADTS